MLPLGCVWLMHASLLGWWWMGVGESVLSDENIKGRAFKERSVSSAYAVEPRRFTQKSLFYISCHMQTRQ
jgi:hypothetical protein